jgi:hypothetical protein
MTRSSERDREGMFEGQLEQTVRATVSVDRPARRSYGVSSASTNTRQAIDHGADRALRERFIKAIVQAIAAGSDPRLVWTLAPL